MPIVNQSWLFKNDGRKYPFSDLALPGPDNGLVDFHIAFPLSLVSNPLAKLYVDSLIVSENVGRVSVSLEGYLNASGTSQLATLEVFSPEPYRLYGLTTGRPDVHGFVMFGGAARNGGTAISTSLTSSTGEILPSLVHRFPVASTVGFQVGGNVVTGNVLFQGGSGVVCAVEDVYFDTGTETPGSRKAMVIRLDRDPQIMTKMIPGCKVPVESGLVQGLVTAINGVRPDTQGAVYLQFESAYDLKYDLNGDILYGPDGLPMEDATKPLVTLQPGETNVLTMVDQYDYVNNCRNRKRSITYTSKKCGLCLPSEQDPGGFDKADGVPISFSGASIKGNVLTVNWDFYGRVSARVGPDPVAIRITTANGPVQVVGVIDTVGSTSALPGDILFCSDAAVSSPVMGVPAMSRYQLSRSLADGEVYSLEGGPGVIQDNPADGVAPYSSGPFTTCDLRAQNPGDG